MACQDHMSRIQLIDVPYNIKLEIAVHLDGTHPTINPITFAERMGFKPGTAQHVANYGEGSSPTLRVLNALQQENKSLWDVYCVLEEMDSSAVQVLKKYWLCVSDPCQGIPVRNQGHHSMDLQTEPSSCGCGCQNNLSHSSSLQPPQGPQTSNFPPHCNDSDDSTRTKTLYGSEESLLFLPPEEPESDGVSVSDLMNDLEEIGNRNNPSSVENSNGSPVAQRSPATLSVHQEYSCQEDPMPAHSSVSSHIPPFSTPCPGISQTASRGSPRDSPHRGHPAYSENNLPGPQNVLGDGSNFHLGSQLQLEPLNNQAPHVRAQSSPSRYPQSSSPQLVQHQLQMFPQTPVSQENPQTARPVTEVKLLQATQQHALESAPQVPFVLVVYGEKDWKEHMEVSIRKHILELLCNNNIPYITCSPGGHWHAQPEDLVNMEEVRRDNVAFRERVFKKASAIIVAITPKVKRYANPSSSCKDGVRLDVLNIVRSMRYEVSRPAGNKRFFPVIMTQLGANKEHNFFLQNTIVYSFPSKIQQRDFICHLQKKLS